VPFLYLVGIEFTAEIASKNYQAYFASVLDTELAIERLSGGLLVT
jgi:hypothetical protein